MIVLEISEAFVKPVDDVVRIQIPIRLLCTDRLRNSLIRGRLKRLVGVPPQGKGDPLQPFVQIAVLENEAAKGPLFLSGCDPEIAHTVTGRRIRRQPVIQSLPLIRNSLTNQRFPDSRKEAVIKRDSR